MRSPKYILKEKKRNYENKAFEHILISPINKKILDKLKGSESYNKIISKILKKLNSEEINS